MWSGITMSTMLCLLLSGADLAVAAVSSLKHPGIYFTKDRIVEYRTNALSGNEPWASAYDSLLSVADKNYKMAGPAPVIGRHTGDATIERASAAFDNDAKAVEAIGVAFSINLEDEYAQKVAEIIDGWSETLERIENKDNILVSWAGRQMVIAAELVYYENGGWPTGEANYRRAQKMVSDILQPACYAAAQPDRGQPAAGGNQAVLGHAAALVYSVFTNNVTGFNEELEILKLPLECDNFGGSGIQALIHPVTGQNAEAGRDQTHAGEEVGFCEQAAWTAANQGDTSLFDLKGTDGTPLVLLGLEYWTKYNLGHEVPFDDTWYPCCCGNPYAVISDENRGRTDQPFGEAAYRYYVEERGWEMPYTKEWFKNRPLGQNYISFPTLTLAKKTV